MNSFINKNICYQLTGQGVRVAKDSYMKLKDKLSKLLKIFKFNYTETISQLEFRIKILILI